MSEHLTPRILKRCQAPAIGHQIPAATNAMIELPQHTGLGVRGDAHGSIAPPSLEHRRTPKEPLLEVPPDVVGQVEHELQRDLVPRAPIVCGAVIVFRLDAGRHIELFEADLLDAMVDSPIEVSLE